MCGITGFNWNDEQTILKMTSLLHHRGPDGDGIYVNNGISLGHRRLAIIDLSPAGKQPMSNKEETILITFNGEIYNFKELRVLLEKKGYHFHSNTDTEVLLYGYEEWGEKVVEKLRGMFAFAIWDDEKKKLFLARDRLGIRHLYYYWDGRRLMFASEIKALFVHDIPREVNAAAAQHYLNMRYIPGEETMFKGIKKLLPGYTLTLQKQKLMLKQYWDVAFPENRKDSAAEQRLKDELERSVQEHLIADVPVGIYLSSGIDSASIVAMAAKASSKTVNTFTVGFNEETDELEQARRVADYFNTNHHEAILDEPHAELLPKLVWHLDQPHGDPVIVPQFKLAEMAAKKVKVVLSGEGADEILGGYVQYRTMLKAQKAKLCPSLVRTGLIKGMPIAILDKGFDYPSSIGLKGKEKLLELSNDLHDDVKAYTNLVSITSAEDQKHLFRQPSEINTAYWQQGRKPLLNRMLYYDLKNWLPNYPLFVSDRMTMAHSLEGRVPFLDHQLAEYAMSLHSSHKIAGGENKVVLRRAMQDVLPTTKQPKKPFFMPLDRWYKNELQDLAEKLFTPSAVKQRGYFHYEQLQKIWKNYHSSKLLYGKQLFTFINLELWQRMFIDPPEMPQEVSLKRLL